MANEFKVKNGIILGNTPALTSISTDIPVFQTHAININGSQQGIYSWSSTATTAATQIFLKSKSNTIGTRGIVGINDTVGAIRFAGDDGAAFIESASITSEIDATPGTNDMPGRLIFSTTADGTAAPTERMRITNDGRVGIGGSPGTSFSVVNSKAITGATTQVGYGLSATIASDVTTLVAGYRSLLATQAAAFTLPSLYYYEAIQGTFGATSVVTNQYGFVAGNTLTGATNNYGFYSNIASGTSRVISFVERTTNVVTITTTVAHGYTAGQSVTVAATTNTGVNGTFTITNVPAATTFTYAQTAATIVLVADTGSTIVVGRYNFYANGTAPNYFAGNVGIGTTSPEVILHAVGDVIQQTFLNGRLSSFFQSRKARGTISSPTAVISGDTIGGMLGVGYDGTAYRSTAAVSFYADGAVSTSNVPQAITFSTGTTNFYSERMRIASTGTPSIGGIPGAESLRVTPASGAVNFLDVTGSSGTAPTLSAQGSGGNIDIVLTPKGTGGVAVGAASAGGYKLYVNGSFAATTKSFLIDHPTKPNMKLRHGSLEGPENGVYIRGKLEGHIIELPEYWTRLVDPDSITVTLTPIGSHQKLYIKDIVNNKVYVGNENPSSTTIKCFYVVYAERCDVDKLQVEIE